MCWPHHCTDCTYDGTAPLNCPWNTRTKCDLTIHQYTFLNNSGIFTFIITATLKVHLKASIDFTVCPSVLWGEEKQHKKPLPENLPQCALHTQLHHPKPASLTQFPSVIIYSQTTCGFYQKALCTTHSPVMQAMIYFHASTAAEAWTLHCQWLPGHRRALCGLGGSQHPLPWPSTSSHRCTTQGTTAQLETAAGRKKHLPCMVYRKYKRGLKYFFSACP